MKSWNRMIKGAVPENLSKFSQKMGSATKWVKHKNNRLKHKNNVLLTQRIKNEARMGKFEEDSIGLQL